MQKKPIERWKSILGYILAVIAFAGAFLLVKEFKNEWYGSKSFQDASISAENNMEKNIQHAQSKATTDKYTTEILAEKAHKDIKNTLSAAKTNKQKLNSASNYFFGAYFLNTRTQPEYCANLGVSITSFVKEYSKVHHKLFVSAEKLKIIDFEEHGYTYNEEILYSLIESSQKKLIKQQMQDTAAYLETTEKEVCQSFEQSPSEWVKETDFSKRHPELTQLLLQQR